MTLPDCPNFKSHFAELLSHALHTLSDKDLNINIEFARPKQANHGDYSCNLAMQLAKPLRQDPRTIATLLISAMPSSPYLEKVEVAGAGFINLFLTIQTKQQFPRIVLKNDTKFGCGNYGKNKKIQIEFVSANPTGPLHVGHGRGAAFGASLANVLTTAGFCVSREYYVNDAGRQMDILAVSTWLRYLELNGKNVLFPSNAYQGEYVRNMAQLIYKAHGNRYVRQHELLTAGVASDRIKGEDDSEMLLDQLITETKNLLGEDYTYIHNFVLTEQLGDCRNDLMEFGVVFDSWFQEQALFEDGMVAHVIKLLKQKNYL